MPPAGVVAQALDRAGAGADALDRGDLLLQGEDRLDLQRRADPGAGAADAAAAAQVLEGVDRKPHLQLLARLPGAGEDRFAVAAGPGGRGGREHRVAHPAAGRARVEEVDPISPLALGDEPLARLPGCLEGPRDAGGDVDRDDLAAFVEQGLVDRGEVPDGGLRGRRAFLGGAQALVESGVVGDLRLRLLGAVDSHVEADDMDPVRGDQLGGQVGRRVADDRDVGAGTQDERFSQVCRYTL